MEEFGNRGRDEGEGSAMNETKMKGAAHCREE